MIYVSARTKNPIFRSGTMVVSPIEMSTHQFIRADFPDYPSLLMQPGLLFGHFKKNVLKLIDIRNLKFSLPKIGIKSSSLLFPEFGGYGSGRVLHSGLIEISYIKLNKILIGKPRFILRGVLQHPDFFRNC
jgi:hypothetical protein